MWFLPLQAGQNGNQLRKRKGLLAVGIRQGFRELKLERLPETLQMKDRTKEEKKV